VPSASEGRQAGFRLPGHLRPAKPGSAATGQPSGRAGPAGHCRLIPPFRLAYVSKPAEAWAIAEREGRVAKEGRQRNSPGHGELIRDARSHFGKLFGVGETKKARRDGRAFDVGN
jgi:hypothetical protein